MSFSVNGYFVPNWDELKNIKTKSTSNNEFLQILEDGKITLEEYTKIKKKYLNDNPTVKAEKFISIFKEDLARISNNIKQGSSNTNFELDLNDEIKNEFNTINLENNSFLLGQISKINNELIDILNNKNGIDTKKLFLIGKEINQLKNNSSTIEEKNTISILENNFKNVLSEGVNLNINFDNIKNLSDSNISLAIKEYNKSSTNIKQAVLLFSIAENSGIKLDNHENIKSNLELLSSKLIETGNYINKSSINNALNDVKNTFSSIGVILNNQNTIQEPRTKLTQLIAYLDNIPKNDPQYLVFQEAMKDDNIKSLYYSALLVSQGESFTGIQNAVKTLGNKSFNNIAENFLITEENLKNIKENSPNALKISKIISDINFISESFKNTSDLIRDIRENRQENSLAGFFANLVGTKLEDLENLEGKLIENSGNSKIELIKHLKDGNIDEFKKSLDKYKNTLKDLGAKSNKILDKETSNAEKMLSTVKGIEKTCDALGLAFGIGAVGGLAVKGFATITAKQIGKKMLVKELGEEGLKHLTKQEIKQISSQLGSKALSEFSRTSLPTFTRIGTNLSSTMSKTGKLIFSEVGATRALVTDLVDTSLNFVQVDKKTGEVKFSPYDFEGNLNYLSVIGASAPWSLRGLNKIKSIENVTSDLNKTIENTLVKPSSPKNVQMMNIEEINKDLINNIIRESNEKIEKLNKIKNPSNSDKVDNAINIIKKETQQKIDKLNSTNNNIKINNIQTNNISETNNNNTLIDNIIKESNEKIEKLNKIRNSSNSDKVDNAINIIKKETQQKIDEINLINSADKLKPKRVQNISLEELNKLEKMADIEIKAKNKISQLEQDYKKTTDPIERQKISLEMEKTELKMYDDIRAYHVPNPPGVKAPPEVFTDYPKLKVLEDILKVEDYNNPTVRKNVEDLAKFPLETLKKLKNKGLKEIHIANLSMPDMDSNISAKGQDPRGWNDDLDALGIKDFRRNWDMVPGAYNPISSSVVAGVGRHGSSSLTIHETSHAIGNKFTDSMGNRLDHSQELQDIYMKIRNNLGPYYNQLDDKGNLKVLANCEETFAEGLADLIEKGERYTLDKYGQEFLDFMKKYVLS